MDINKFSDEQIAENKEQFCRILRKISRSNANIEGLITRLNQSDFFYAPASSKYHNACFGGLVAHSLNVYHNLENLIRLKDLSVEADSIIICSLLHDISKMNLYEQSSRNKKVYSPTGTKYDEIGAYDWVSERSFAKRSVEDIFIYGNHEQTSEFMVRQYIPLKLEESVAILNHHGGMGYDSAQTEISKIFNKYPLAMMLHTADMLATYTDERL